jgi:hypothetical protein
MAEKILKFLKFKIKSKINIANKRYIFYKLSKNLRFINIYYSIKPLNLICISKKKVIYILWL